MTVLTKKISDTKKSTVQKKHYHQNIWKEENTYRFFISTAPRNAFLGIA